MQNLTKQHASHSRLFLIMIASIAAIGGLLFGYDTGIISGALIYLSQDFHISTFLQELVVSCVVLGALFGALISGKLADLFGRRRMLIIVSVLFILGTIIATFGSNIITVIIGRLIIGLAIGISSYIVPLYISEVSTAKHRGALVLINAIAITGGEALAFLIDEWLVPTHSWRLMFATCVIPALLLLIGMLFVPETPRWLVLNNFVDKAKTVLSKIRFSTQNHQLIQTEIDDIQQSLVMKSTRWRNIFSKKIIGVLIVGIMLGVLQQFVGINTVMYYGPYIFKAAGLKTPEQQLWATFGMGVMNMIASIVTLIIIDHIGRRKLLMIGIAIAAMSLAIVGYAFYSGLSSALLSKITVIFLFIYIMGYSVSIGSLFWLIISEIYPLEVRGMAMSFVTAMQWLANFLVALTFLSIVKAFGPATTFWLYGVMCVITLLFSYYFVPETTGISLELIEENLIAGKKLRDLGRQIS